MEFTPASIGAAWVLPDVDDPAANPVDVRIAIAVTEDDALTGADIAVTASAAGTALAQLTAPDASTALPITELKGLTAHAFFTFENAQGGTVDTIVVTLKNEPATFGGGPTPVA